MLSTPVGRFRAIALLEGVSFLVLLLIAMPIKYAGNDPRPVLYVGWAHGVLFMLYAVAGFQAKFARGWPMSEAVRGFVAAVVPLGTFFYDAWFLRKEQAAELAARGVASDLQHQR